jgi:hypothetical protein
VLLVDLGAEPAFSPRCAADLPGPEAPGVFMLSRDL